MAEKLVYINTIVPDNQVVKVSVMVKEENYISIAEERKRRKKDQPHVCLLNVPTRGSTLCKTLHSHSLFTLRDIDSATRVHTMDKAVCFTHSTDTLCKGMNATILTSAIVDHTERFKLGVATNQREEKLWIQTYKNLFLTRNQTDHMPHLIWPEWKREK